MFTRTFPQSDGVEFSDVDTASSDIEEQCWRRSSPMDRPQRRDRRCQRSSLKWSALFDVLFMQREKTKKRMGKRDKKPKLARWSYRPRSSQEWGLLFLAFLLAAYLADFVNHLYLDNANEQIEIRNHPYVRNEQRNGFSAERVSENGNATSRTVSQEFLGDREAFPVTAEPKQIFEFKKPEQRAVFSIERRTSGTRDLPTNPMNRNMLALQVPGNSGRLTVAEVKSYYRRLAKAYLATFAKGIYRQMYFDVLRRRTYSLTPPGANKGVQTILFQIVDGKVFIMDPYEVPRNSKPFYRTRINQVIWLLSKMALDGRIRNTEFLMAIHDCVQTVNKPHQYRGAHYQESNPTFTIVACNFSDNIPFPMWEGSKHRDGGFLGWDNTIKSYAKDDVPWHRKKDLAVFRGGNRPSMYFKNKSEADFHCHEVGRTRLQYLSNQQPDVLDVSIGGTCGGVRTHLDRMDPRDHHKYKYILYAEGNCMWADRSRTQIFGPSVIIKQETPCGQFFEPLMRPNTHYIPTDFFFRDTIEKVVWARAHDEKAREIVTNANQFALNFLTLTGIEAYVEVLLDEYTKLLVEPDVRVEYGAVDVTNKRV